MSETNTRPAPRVAAIRNFLDGLECILGLLPEDLARRVREINSVVQGTSSGVQRVRLAARHVPVFDAMIAENPGHTALLFYRGFLKRTSEDFEAAYGDLTEALRLHPGQAQGHFWRATALGALHRFPEAVSDLDRAIALAPNCAEYYKLRGQANEKARRLEDAVRDFDRAIELDPKYDWPFIGRSMVHAGLGHWKEALADLDAAIARNASEEWAFLKRSLVRRRLGDNVGAVRDVTRACEINPSCDWANANMPGHGGNLDEALADIDQAALAAPDDAWVNAWRGQTLMKAGRLEEADAELTRALGGDLGAHRGWVLAWRGETRRLEGRLKEAAGDLDEAVRLSPEYPRAFLWRGQTAFQSGRVEEAIGDFDQAGELDDRMPEIHFHAGEARRSLGRLEEALRCYTHALKLNPTDERAFKARAEVKAGLGDVQGQIDDFVSSYAKVQVPPQEWRQTRQKLRSEAGELAERVWLQLTLPAEAWAGMAREAYEAGDAAAALEFCARGLEQKELQAPWLLHAWKAVALRKLGRSREAVAAATKSLELRPDCLWPLAVRGEAFRDLGAPLRGFSDLSEALHRDPKAAFALEFLDPETASWKGGKQEAWVYAAVGAALRAREESARAEALLRRAVELDAEYGVAWGWLGESRLHGGDVPGALDHFTRAERLLPHWPDLHFWRADALQREGRHKEAEACLTRSLELGAAGCAPYLARAASRAALGDEAGQIEDFTRAVRCDPALFHSQARRGGGAAAELLRGLLLKTRRAALWTARSRRALARGDTSAAQRHLGRASEADPGAAEPYVYRARLKRRGGDAEGARADLNEAFKREPSALILRERAECAVMDGATEEALADFAAALALRPEAATYLLRGKLLQAQGQAGDAVADFERACALEPDSPSAWEALESEPA